MLSWGLFVQHAISIGDWGNIRGRSDKNTQAMRVEMTVMVLALATAMQAGGAPVVEIENFIGSEIGNEARRFRLKY